MGIPTLIKTLTASDSASLSFVDGTSDVVLDSTYDEYMFVFTDIGPAVDQDEFMFQVNAAGGSGFNETITSTFFQVFHDEADAGSSLGIAYHASHDQGQGTAYQHIAYDLGNDSDESTSGILHLFSPSSTTYVTHFYSRVSGMKEAGEAGSHANEYYVAGYINATAAIDEIDFKFNGGNFDGVIQMYGIA
jgi:hypothetical protein